MYQKLLEFYQTVYKIVTKHGARLVLQILLSAENLPKIVEEFIKQTELLARHIQKATAEIVEDIQHMLYDEQSMLQSKPDSLDILVTNNTIVANWLKREKVTSQGAYQVELKRITAPEACEYLKEDAKVIQWYTDENCQSLALIGDTGSGKSVSMSFLIEFLTDWNRTQVIVPKLCYYYCRDGSTGNIVSILCGLTFSLLMQLKGLKKTFVEWYRTVQQDYGTPDPAADPDRLMVFLELTVQSLDRPLQFLIDGLDECDRTSRNTIVEFLTKLADSNKKFKYLLSSRPREEILELLGSTERIHLEANLERDRVIVSKLVKLHLPHLSESVKHMIRERLAPLAQGSGIWAKMIVASIESSEIRAESSMCEFLKELPLPSDLSTLYKKIFDNKASTTEKSKLGALALDFLAAARRDLSIKELTCAVTLGTASMPATTVAEVERRMDYQRLMDIIQPFISHIDFKDLTSRQVRLVHQSVREFIVAKGHIAAKGSEIDTEQATMDIVGQRVDRLERRVLDLCIEYLLLDDIAAQPLFSATQIAVIELPQEVDLFTEEEGPNNYTVECSWDTWEEGMSRYDPTERGFGHFFVYASTFWIKHLGHVTQKPLPAVSDIERLCHSKSLRFHNWTQQNCRPGCAVQARYEFDSERFDPLSIVSLYASEAILHHVLEHGDFSNNSYLPNSSLAAAEHILEWGDLSCPMESAQQKAQWGNLSRLRILFDHGGFKSQLHTLKFFRLLIRQWVSFKARHSNWDEAFDLVNQVFGTMVTDQWGYELLSVAAYWRCKPMIERLMKEAGHNAMLQAELWRAPCSPVSSTCVQHPINTDMPTNGVNEPPYIPEHEDIEALIEYINVRDQAMPAMERSSSAANNSTAPAPSQKSGPTKQEQVIISSEQDRILKTRGTW